MLAQNLKTPADLGITDLEFEGLVKALGMFEREEIRAEQFSMGSTGDYEFHEGADCGTPACICGWARHAVRARVFDCLGGYPQGIRNLFMMYEPVIDPSVHPFAATPAQAAIALRNYLTHGEPRWAEALA